MKNYLGKSAHYKLFTFSAHSFLANVLSSNMLINLMIITYFYDNFSKVQFVLLHSILSDFNASKCGLCFNS